MRCAPEVLNEDVTRLLGCTHAGEAKPVVDALVGQLAGLTGLELRPDGFRDEHATRTARGTAVSPTTAAQCGEDVERTRVFLQGVRAAVTHLLARGAASEPVHVLYAGTGPFGLLLVPLLPLLPPAARARLRVTLLDIHADSLRMLKEVVEHLGVQACIAAYVEADVCDWEPAQRFDMILSETMNAGLEREPQVSVFAHACRFLTEGGLLIPEAITVDLWLSRGSGGEPAAVDPHPPVRLGQLFRLDRASAAALGGDVRAGLQGSFPVPPYSAVLEHLEIATRIQVFGPHELRERQSSLTLPLFVKHARVRPESELHYRYELVPRPRWVFEYERRPEGLETQLPDPWEASPAGLLHLPRLWHRTQLQKHRPRDASDRVRVRALLSSVPADEWELDQQLFVGLGVELQAGMARLFSAHTLPDLEAWLLSQRADLPQHQLIAQVNQGLRARLERSGG